MSINISGLRIFSLNVGDKPLPPPVPVNNFPIELTGGINDFFGTVAHNFPVTLTTSIFTGVGVNNFPITLNGAINNFLGGQSNNFPITLSGGISGFYGHTVNAFPISLIGGGS